MVGDGSVGKVGAGGLGAGGVVGDAKPHLAVRPEAIDDAVLDVVVLESHRPRDIRRDAGRLVEPLGLGLQPDVVFGVLVFDRLGSGLPGVGGLALFPFLFGS